MPKQELVMVICRANLDLKIIPPLRVILPALALLSPISLYSSMAVCFKSDNHFENLLAHLQKEEGVTSLTSTLRLVLEERKGTSFRVCIVGGEHIDWDIILEYKKRGIIIDTAGSHPRLSQISYTTGGITRDINESTMIKLFLTIFSMDKCLRRNFAIEQNKNVYFSLQCCCCVPSVQLNKEFYVCSVCLAVYCLRKDKRCKLCGYPFD